ncbi:MAG: sugar transferase [Clostridiales bacterium]|nr:sugar transferase [Clostridiales bacterium]
MSEILPKGIGVTFDYISGAVETSEKEFVSTKTRDSVDIAAIDIAKVRIASTAGKIGVNTKDVDVIDYILNFHETYSAYLFLKRAMDVIVSLIAIFLGALLLWPLAIAIKTESKGPVFFKQKRVGKNEHPFTMYKFRSMTDDAESELKALMTRNERDGPAFKMKNDPRVTKVGSFMRKSCIDELPQFINVLAGHMTIVGPRPALPSETNEYNEYHRNRIKVKPGLTCYWQISKAQPALSFNEWVDTDILYIINRNIFEDINIILMTIIIMIRNAGGR